jgi:hypothetical protein
VGARLARALALVAAGALALAAAGGSAPSNRLLRPGEHLGGVRIGMTKARVLAVWGARHGVCRDCRRTTWYFNDRPFEPEGTGVVFERGRVVHAFTVWQPRGWRTPAGLELGAPAAEIARAYGPLDRRGCSGYYALLAGDRRAQTVYYVYRNEVWGFGLTVPEASPCL